MSIPIYDTKEIYTGTGSLDTYTFNFKIIHKNQLIVAVINADGVEVQRVRGTDTVYLSDVIFDDVNGGGSVILQAVLPASFKIAIILAEDTPTQDFEFRNKTSFSLRRFEDALDAIVIAVQSLALRFSQAIRINDFDNESTFNTQLPSVVDKQGRLLQLNDTGDQLIFGPEAIDYSNTRTLVEGWRNETEAFRDQAEQFAEEAAGSAEDAALAAASAGGGGLPIGGLEGEFIELDALLDPVWKSGSYDGISALTGAQFTSTGLKDTLDKIIRITYTPAAISLSASPSQALREKGTLVSSVDLVATTTKRSNPIGAVRFYRAGVLVDTVVSPSPTGGANNYTNSTPFSDTMSFYAQVDDTLADGNGPTTTQSNTVTYSYVYPYYVGAGAQALSAAAVAGLTKLVIASTASSNRSFTTTSGQVYYFAYPASYGALTSIKDVNNFETFGDWTLRTENITGLDGNPVSYRIYEFNNPVVAGTTSYTFIR